MLYCRALCCAHGAILVSLIFLSISLKNGSIYIHWVEWIRIHLLNKVKTSTIDFHFFINQLQNAYLSLSMCWLPSKVRMYVSVQFSRSVMSDSLRPHESQHSRPPCPSPTPGAYSNSRPLSWWCHPAISSSVVPFSSCPQFLPASGPFPMSQLFAWGGQSIGVSASTSLLPMNTQDLSPLGWTGWISLQSKGLWESSPTPQFKSINFLALSFLHSPTLTSIQDHWKNHSFD